MIMAVLGFVIADSITKPVSRLVEGTNAVAQGDLSYQIDLPRKDELGQLATAFNRMTAKLLQVNTQNDQLYQETRQLADELEKRVEQRTVELRVSEEKFRGAFEHAAIGRAIAGLDGQFVQINPAMCKMLGYEQEELLSMNWQQVTHPDYLAENYGYVEKLISGQIPSYQMELKLIHKKGIQELVWAKLSVFLLRDEHGSPEYMIGDIENITQSKQAAQALQASEERYRILSESSPEMIFVIDKNDQVSYVNQLAASQFRKTPEQVIGKPRTELFPPNIAEGQTYGLQHVFKTGQTLESESVIEFPGGQLWLDTQLVPIMDGTGDVSSVMGISRDITDRKRNEKMIAEEKALSESIINSLPGIFYLFDDQGRFLRWNKNFELVSGYSSEEMLERNPLEFFTGEEKGLVQERIQETFVKGESHVEANFTSRDGKSTPYLLTGIRAVMNDQTYLIGTGIDITDQKTAEEKLRASEAELRALLAALPDIILVLDAEGRYLKVASTSASLLAMPPNELEGQLMHDVMPRETADLLLGKIAEALQSGEPTSAEYSLPIDEQIVWFAGIASPMSDNTVVWAAREITERIKYEENLHSLNERFALATHSAQMGVWDLDVVNNNLVWDDQMYALYGVKQKDFPVAYDAWEASLHPDDRCCPGS